MVGTLGGCGAPARSWEWPRWDGLSPHARGIGEVLEALLAIIDGTEPRIQRPQDPEAQQPHDSGRRKTHTCKTIIAVDNEGHIRAMTPSAPGSPPDWSLTVESGMIAPISESISVIGDAGCDGLQNDYPDRSMATPHRARRNPPLLPDPKRAHPGRASMRMGVEHMIGWRKRFQILASVFRHMLSLDDTVFLAVVGIMNFRMDRRCRRAESIA
ncbi:transposase family protein [Thermoflexus sp.]|uniref:transposase family protein n=1 Tax=Thermoflexus sp. TaxID=1969742 RepID=UPI0035E44356